ncbi:MAG TPA: polysaccharide biosynthesis tyrosine autokinase [Longimicrobium sp.]|nr:polysaccharide biosynthesis tyrosine autokinase [Longimicrobium sp.]
MAELTPTSRLLPEVSERAPRTPVLRTSLTPPDAGADSREGIPLREYLSALRRYGWLVAAAVLLSVGFAGYRLSRELPMFAASTAIRLIDPKVQMGGELDAGEQGQLPGWYTDPILSQIQVLKSRAVAREVVDSLGLRLRPVRPNFAYGALADVSVNSAARDGDSIVVRFTDQGSEARHRGRVVKARYGEPLELSGVRVTFTARPPGPQEEAFTIVSRDEAASAVLGGIQARPREMTNVIDIGYLAYDPHLAQRIADATARGFQRLNAQSAQQQSRRRALFIAEQLRSTDSLLMKAQYELSDFRKGVQAFSPREKFRTTQESLGELRLRRDALDRERRVYDQMHQELQADRGREGAEQIAALAASPEVATNGGVVALYQQLIRYQTLRDSVTTGKWGASTTNPDVERLDSLIETSKSRLVRAVGARGTALAAQIGVFDELMGADAASIRALPDAEAEEQRLGRQVETLQTLVDDLLREQQKARIDQAVEAGQVEIVDPALVPEGPIGRGGKKRMLFALLVGLMIGGGGALVLDRMNTTLFKREELESYLHLPTLAVIPRISAEAGKRGRRRLPVPKNALARRPLNPSDGLITVNDLHSSGSQAYRKLRTHLIFSTAGEGLRTLLVTSPAASEGKSTVCANLAVTFAQQRLRVVLVDGDLRRSRIHHVFGTERVPGLTEVLTGSATLDEAVRPTAVEGLSVLPAGVLVPNASELLGGPTMRALLAELAQRFDLVVVDTPPVMAAADAEILGVQTDAVLVVVRAGQTERQAAQYAVQQLRAIGARVIGAVLNDPDEKVPGYGRYGYYYDYYSDAPSKN